MQQANQFGKINSKKKCYPVLNAAFATWYMYKRSDYVLYDLQIKNILGLC